MKNEDRLKKINELIDDLLAEPEPTAAQSVALGGLRTAREFLMENSALVPRPASPVVNRQS